MLVNVLQPCLPPYGGLHGRDGFHTLETWVKLIFECIPSQDTECSLAGKRGDSPRISKLPYPDESTSEISPPC